MVGGRAEIRAMEPDEVVRRRERGEVSESGGRRVRVVGKWPVWKVARWRRRWPERDLGSLRLEECWLVERKEEKGEAKRTIGVELENVKIAVRISDGDVELFSVWEKIGRNDFYVM